MRLVGLQNLINSSLYTCEMSNQCFNTRIVENVLFYRVHSVWMFFHRVLTINNDNIMIHFVSFKKYDQRKQLVYNQYPGQQKIS